MKGFAPILIVVLVAVVALGGGAYIYTNYLNLSREQSRDELTEFTEIQQRIQQSVKSQSEFKTQKECEDKTGQKCLFNLCQTTTDSNLPPDWCTPGWYPEESLSTPQSESTSSANMVNWKTYENKDGLFRISYPSRWSENSLENQLTLGENRIEIGIIVWNDGTTEYAETQWKQIGCAQGNDQNGGCRPSNNKEENKLSLNSYTVYFKIDGDGAMHAYIPNQAKNKTVEIYSVYLTDRKIFDQILSTFKFLP